MKEFFKYGVSSLIGLGIGVFLVHGSQVSSITNSVQKLYRLEVMEEGNNNSKIILEGDGGDLSMSGDLKIDEGALKDGVVTSGDILDGTIGTDDIGTNGVDTNEIVEDSVTNTEVDNDGDFKVNQIKANKFLYSSDRRLKKDIQSLKDSLEKINKLDGYSYEFKKSGKTDIGLIAQQVQKVFPRIVNQGKQGMLSVEYANLVAPIIESIKVLDKYRNINESKIKDLERKNNKLDQKINSLEKEIKKIKSKINS